MEHHERRQVAKDVLVDVTCDRCGESCNKATQPGWRHFEYGRFTAIWGYNSDNKDGQEWEADLCEACCDLFFEWMDQGVGTVRVETHLL